MMEIIIGCIPSIIGTIFWLWLSWYNKCFYDGLRKTVNDAQAGDDWNKPVEWM